MARDDSPRATLLSDYQQPAYLIDTAVLHFDLRERATRVRSRLALRRNPALQSQSPGGALRLDGEGLSLRAIAIDGRPLDGTEYSIDAESLTLHAPPEAFLLETEAEIVPEDNTALEGLYVSAGMYCTQCEAEGFRKITWFLDRPDVMTRFTTTIEADRGCFPVLLSNGNPLASGPLDGGRHYATWEDPFPKPSYLFALVAGDLRCVEDSYATLSGRQVALRIYVEPHNVDKCDHAMRSLKKAMRWDEEVYGREYDLDIYMIVAVSDFNMGAMENKGLNVFNAKFVLARPETATDRDFQGIESVIAHEYFHNWTGNRITCRDWFQLSLKEGLTVFRDQEFSADMGSRGVKRIEDVRLLRAHQFTEDAGPMAHPVRPDSYIEINNFYTATVYQKGAEVVRMQANLLGPALFRRATDLYFARHDGQAVTTDDFVRCMEGSSGRDLTQFRRWYTQAGTPQVDVTDAYDPSARVYTLTLRQSCPPTPGQPEKVPFHIPFAVGLIGTDGRDLPLQLEGEAVAGSTTRVLELRETEQSFCFVDIPGRPVPSLLRGFSAPVKVRFDCADDALMFLMAHDSDGFNRWDAAQTLAQRVILARLGEPERPLPEGFIAAVGKALTDPKADRALIAEVLTLPSESYLGDQLPQVDVDGIHAARETVKRALASALREDLLRAFRTLADDGPYDIEPPAIARRSLRNVALAYLMNAPDAEVEALCLAQYRAAHNMTDVMAALALIADSDHPEREAVLGDFRARWADDPLVLDKWFSVQAAARGADTLWRVVALMGDPAFSIRNPNKVRALIGAFAGNVARFHARDGAGYAFLADRVLELDPLNPQVAARMLRAMARWRRYDPERQRLMRRELERIAAAPGLSKDSYEVAAKSLEA
jgi:aminopeptidase N